MTRRFISFVLLIFVLAGHCAVAEKPDNSQKPSSLYYSCDFEDLCPVLPWCNNIKPAPVCNIGLSREKRTVGKKSCKVEVEVPEGAAGHYYYLEIPLPMIPLRNPTIISMDIYNRGIGGCVGVIASVEGKDAWHYFAKEGGFPAKDNKWEKIRLNVYPQVMKTDDPQKKINENSVFLSKIWFQFSTKPPSTISFYIDNLYVDYLRYNPECIGKPNKELYAAVKSETDAYRQKYEAGAGKNVSPEYYKRLQNISNRLQEIEKDLPSDLSAIAILASAEASAHGGLPPEASAQGGLNEKASGNIQKAADIRVQLDNITDDYINTVIDLEIEDLFRD